MITDPANSNYVSNVSLGAQNGLDHVVSFSEDNNGNLYMIDFGYGTTFDGQYTASAGEIFKIVPGALAFPATAVWKGNEGASWSTNASASSNFTISATGSALNPARRAIPRPTLSSGHEFRSATNYSTVLNKDFFVNSLTVQTGSTQVTIGSGTSGTATLVVLGSAGVTVESASKGLAISSNVELGDHAGLDRTTLHQQLLINGNVTGPGAA